MSNEPPRLAVRPHRRSPLQLPPRLHVPVLPPLAHTRQPYNTRAHCATKDCARSHATITTMRKRHGPARDRQLKAVELHLAGHTYSEIAKRLGYRSEAGARMAVNRDFARRSAGVDERREKHSARLETLIASHWSGATSGGDAVAAGVVLRAMADLSRLWGMDAAQRHLVVGAGITETEFAAKAAQLLAVTGDRPLLELAASALPPWQRAALYDEPVDPEPDLEWSNIGMDQSPLYARAGIDAEDFTPEPEPDAEPPTAVVVERVEAEPTTVVVEEVEEIVAEVIPLPPLPPGQRRIPASEVLNANGVPISRSGIARRRGGYDPLAAWRP